MHVGSDTWSADHKRRTVHSARLVEVSLVGNPANTGAVASVRAEGSGGAEVEIRQVGALAVVEQRRDYSESEKAALGKQGRAIWIDGHWAYPVASASDFANAVTSLGRTPGRNRVKVRKYLLGLARKYGYEAPSSWASDGTTKSASGRSASYNLGDLRRELRGERRRRPPPAVTKTSSTRALRAELNRLSRSARGATSRDREERLWLRLLTSKSARPAERAFARRALDEAATRELRGPR